MNVEVNDRSIDNDYGPVVYSADEFAAIFAQRDAKMLVYQSPDNGIDVFTVDGQGVFLYDRVTKVYRLLPDAYGLFDRLGEIIEAMTATLLPAIVKEQAAGRLLEQASEAGGAQITEITREPVGRCPWCELLVYDDDEYTMIFDEEQGNLRVPVHSGAREVCYPAYVGITL